MAKWYEWSTVSWIRSLVQKDLENEGLPPSKEEYEAPAEFWSRVEQAGLLEKALDLYDQYAKDDAEWIHRPRETKKMFAERKEREGRQAEVEAARKQLAQEGYSLREIQTKLAIRPV